MDTIIGDCPLGAKCEEAKEINGKQVLVRCPWYVSLRGRDGNKNEEVDEWGCAISWNPMLMANLIGRVVQTTIATEELRNEVVEGNEKTMKALKDENKLKLIGGKDRSS